MFIFLKIDQTYIGTSKTSSDLFVLQHSHTINYVKQKNEILKGWMF